MIFPLLRLNLLQLLSPLFQFQQNLSKASREGWNREGAPNIRSNGFSDKNKTKNEKNNAGSIFLLQTEWFAHIFSFSCVSSPNFFIPCCHLQSFSPTFYEKIFCQITKTNKSWKYWEAARTNNVLKSCS